MCCGITLDGSLNVTAKTLVSSIEYAYNSKGLLSKKTVAVGSTQAIYYTEYPENASPVVKVTVNGKTIECHSKTDSFGRKVFDELRLGTGFVSRQFSYHAGKATEEHKKNGKLKSSPTTNLVSRIVLSDGGTLSYAYDAEERITSVTETYVIDEATVTNTTAYTYDEMGRLLTETVNGTAVNTMTYDAYGNILTKNGVNYVYDNVWKDLLTSYNGQSITYDAQGNPTNYLGHTLTWEKGRQLKSFDNNTYTYNANGIRTSKTVNGIKHSFALDGSKILREEWCGNTLIPLYDNADSVCGIMYNGQHYFFLKNLQGDVIAITDSNGNTVARYSYDAWGACTVTQDSSNRSIATVNPYRYRGYYFDSETGLYYLQSRYYDPKVGRFINADAPDYVADNTSIARLNIYKYCLNNPINCVDADGHDAIFIADRGEYGLPMVGHAVLFYQRGSGEWWYTEFTASEELESFTIEGIKKYKKSARIFNKSYGSFIESYGGFFNRFGKDSRCVYITGDFSKCYAQAEKLMKQDIHYGGYDLFTNNCLHYVIDVAKEGKCGMAYQAYLRLPHLIPYSFVYGLAQLKGILFSINLLASFGIYSVAKKLKVIKSVATEFVEPYLPCC